MTAHSRQIGTRMYLPVLLAALSSAVSFSAEEQYTTGIEGARNQYGHAEEFIGIIDGATAFLLTALRKRYFDVEVTPIILARNPSLPSDIKETIYGMCGDKAVARRMCIVAGIQTEKGQIKRIPIWFQVKAKKKGWVAVVPMHPGTLLRKDLIREAYVNATEIDEPLDIDEIERSRLTRQIVAGAPIVRNSVERITAVNRGQEILVRVGQGLVELEVSAVAMESGDIGKIVKVRRHGDGVYLRTRVVDTGIVTMDGV